MGNDDAGNRAKAYRLRLRAKSAPLKPVDALWLADYDETKERRRTDRHSRIAHDVAAAGGSVGASRAKRTLHLDIDEEKDSVGIGAPTVAAIAAGAALEAKEEGRRLDSLTTGALDIMERAVNTYERITTTLEKHWGIVVRALSESMGQARDQFAELAEADARIKALEAELEGRGATDVNGLVGQVLAAHLKGERKGPPPANGSG